MKVCGCLHHVTSHDSSGCKEWWRYPDVLDARPCGCKGVWQPSPDHSRFHDWAKAERESA